MIMLQNTGYERCLSERFPDRDRRYDCLANPNPPILTSRNRPIRGAQRRPRIDPRSPGPKDRGPERTLGELSRFPVSGHSE
jgi:hypothetical protein